MRGVSQKWIQLVQDTLESDGVFDDVTTKLFSVLQSKRAKAHILSREVGVFSGTEICHAFSQILDREMELQLLCKEGARLEPNQTFLTLDGPAALCLSIERTLLNFLGHSCGVATLTSRFVEAAHPFGVKILATRKTLPGLRDLELRAVQAGGGWVHRRSLSDGILIKDNHLFFGSESEWVESAKRDRSPLHRIEIEVQDLQALDRAVATRPDIILLDNFSLADLKIAIPKLKGIVEVEVSGGVTLENVSAIAALGPHYISVGLLTHSPQNLNLTLDWR